MSKYYKAKDIINLVNAIKGGYGMTKSAEELLADLPTIEVSEDSVSRRYLLAEIDDLADEFSEVDENGLHSDGAE